MSSTAILQRQPPQHIRERQTYWADPHTGILVGPDGKRRHLRDELQSSIYGFLQGVDEVNRAHPARVIDLFIVGGHTVDLRPPWPWWGEQGKTDGASGWTCLEVRKKPAQADYQRGALTVHAYSTHAYWGDALDLDQIRAARDRLQSVLGRAFWANIQPDAAAKHGAWWSDERDGRSHTKPSPKEEVQPIRQDATIPLLNTPAIQGQALIKISLPKERTYPTIADEAILRQLQNVCYQGRVETLPLPDQRVRELGITARRVPRFYQLDGTLMYGACISNLPTGEPVWDQHEEVVSVRTSGGRLAVPDHGVGFYEVTATVPPGWEHIGLLKASRDWQPRAYLEDNGYLVGDDGTSGIYPRHPGETFRNWVSAAELVLALDQGWRIQVHQRILWPNPTTDPLKTWRTHLVETYRAAREAGDRLVAHAIRAILIQTIGSFRQRWTWREYAFPPAYQLTEDELQRIDLDMGTQMGIPGGDRMEADDTYRCVLREPLAAARHPFARTEWAATVWGRARARLAAAALQLQFESIVGCSLDAIWLADLPPADVLERLSNGNSGKPGTFRIKDYGSVRLPTTWPATTGRFRSLLMAANRHDLIDDQDDEDTDLSDNEIE